MSELVRWIRHGQEKILFNDYSGLREQQYLQELDETIALIKEAIAAQEPYLLVLTDVSNTTTTIRITDKAKECTELYKGIKTLSAIVGVMGAKRVIANLLVPGIQICADRDEGLEWLVAEAGQLGHSTSSEGLAGES
jgi:hypothetical protein